MSKLHLICGLPASGKSFFCEQKFGTLIQAGEAVNITRDRIRQTIRGYRFDVKVEDLMKVFEEMLVLEYLRRLNVDVVIDNTCLLISKRVRYMEMVAQAWQRDAYPSPLEVVCYWMATPLDECLRRESMRCKLGSNGGEVIRGMDSKLEFPTKKEGFSEVYYVLQDLQMIGEDFYSPIKTVQ